MRAQTDISKTSNAAFFSVISGRRYYNPALGRWVNRDPVGEAGGLNLYGFGLNNLICFVDPIGFSFGAVIVARDVEVYEFFSRRFFNCVRFPDEKIDWEYSHVQVFAKKREAGQEVIAWGVEFEDKSFADLVVRGILFWVDLNSPASSGPAYPLPQNDPVPPSLKDLVSAGKARLLSKTSWYEQREVSEAYKPKNKGKKCCNNSHLGREKYEEQKLGQRIYRYPTSSWQKMPLGFHPTVPWPDRSHEFYDEELRRKFDGNGI